MIRELRIDKKSAFLSLLIVLGAVAVTPRCLSIVTGCGHDIPQPDLGTDYTKAVVWALFLWLTIFFWPVSRGDKKCLIIGWGAKIIVTLGFMLYYENSYGLDAYMYFSESNKSAFSLLKFTTVGGDAGTRNIINLASLNNLWLPDSYHGLKVSFAMLGMVGVYVFYRSAVLFLGRENPAIFYLIMFFPGILFWSSTLGKDPVAFFAISLYVYGTISWYRRRRYRSLFVIAAGIYFGLLVRVWLGPIMVIPLLVMFLRSPGNRLAKALLVPVACALLVISAGPMLDKFKIAAFEDVFVAADRTTQGFVKTAGGSTQQLDVDLTSPVGILKFLPQAAFTALFRPLPGEVLNPFGLLASLESALLVVLLFKAVRRTKVRELRDPVVLWAVSFVVLWAMMNGIVSSANFGVNVRYKLQILPALLGVLLYLSRDRNKEVAAAAGRFAITPAMPAANRLIPRKLTPEAEGP